MVKIIKLFNNYILTNELDSCLTIAYEILRFKLCLVGYKECNWISKYMKLLKLVSSNILP